MKRSENKISLIKLNWKRRLGSYKKYDVVKECDVFLAYFSE